MWKGRPEITFSLARAKGNLGLSVLRIRVGNGEGHLGGVFRAYDDRTSDVGVVRGDPGLVQLRADHARGDHIPEVAGSVPQREGAIHYQCQFPMIPASVHGIYPQDLRTVYTRQNGFLHRGNIF